MKVKAIVQMGISTKKDGGRPYLRMLSVNTRTAQKCIQELKTFREKKEKITNQKSHSIYDNRASTRDHRTYSHFMIVRATKLSKSTNTRNLN